MTVESPASGPAENPAPRRFVSARALAAPLKRFWAGDFDLGRIGMAVTLPVLAWVFYTTSSGMIDIMQKDPGDVVGIAGTLIATTAVLVMLASTSWSLGADLAALIMRRRMARERMVMKTLVTATVFLFVFSISTFFSFTYYYNNIFKLSSRKIVAELQPMELAAEVVLPATKQINAAYEAASAQMVANPAFRSYLDSLDALIDTARTAGPALREAIRKNQEAQQAVLARAAAQAAAELESARAAAREFDEGQAEIAALDKSVANFDAIIRAKQDEITALAATAKQEEQQAIDAEHGLDNLGAACGPNCKAHKAKAEEANRRAATIRQTLAGPNAERAAALKKRESIAARGLLLKQKADVAAAAGSRPIPKAEASVDLDATLRGLTALRDQLRVDPRWTLAREAKPLCEPILAAARQSNALPATVPRDFACEPQGAAFDRKCSLDGGLRDDLNAVVAKIRAAPASDRAAAANGFNAAKTFVDGCVVAGKTVGLTEDDVRELLKKSDAFLRAHSSERNKFELAREAFWSFTPDSTMAIGVAVAQDGFLFIMKFLSEIFKRGFEARERRQFMTPVDLTDDEGEPVEWRAMKALLRLARPVHGDMSEIDPNSAVVAELSPDVRENLVAILNRLVRDEIAHVDRKGAYVVDNVTISQVESRLFAAMKPRALRHARFGGGGDGGGPQAYYADPTQSHARRRRPSALERYLSVETPPVEQSPNATA
jgi:hypothetical protein